MRRKGLAAASAVMIGAGVALGTALVSPATAAGPDLTYLVLAPSGNSTAKAATRVAAAGGTVVADYRQIGVLVARSANPAFVTAVAGSGVDAVASTAGARHGARRQRDARNCRLGHRTADRRFDRRTAVEPAVGHDPDRYATRAGRHD